MVVYSLHEQGEYNIDEAILKALLFGGKKLDMGKKMRQAMLWNKLDVAKSALEAQETEDSKSKEASRTKSDGSKMTPEEEKNEWLNENLMFALENNNPDFVQLFLEHGAKPYKVGCVDTLKEVFFTSVLFLNSFFF